MSDNWKSRTRQVHGGTRRSQWGEVSEALFLTQGFVYDTAEAAQARFEKAGDALERTGEDALARRSTWWILPPCRNLPIGRAPR